MKNSTGPKTEPCGNPLLLVTMWQYCLVKLLFVPFLKANLRSNSLRSPVVRAPYKYQFYLLY